METKQEEKKQETSLQLSVAEKQARELIKDAQKGFMSVESGLDYNREAQFAIQALANNDFLRKTDPVSIRNAVVNVALCGVTLNPALKLAYLIPRKGKCSLDLSYMGMIEIALNSGVVKDITAEVVCVNDDFYFEKGTSPYIKHTPKLSDRGDMIGAYAIATLPNGEKHFEVLGKDEILKAKNTSEAKNSDYSPWKTWESEMWKKTAVKRLFKYLKKGLNEKLLNVLDIENQNEKLDYEQPKSDKFSDFEIVE
jgi:recombination protein RecT